MSNLPELVHRMERLQNQVELLRLELGELRQELLQMERGTNGLPETTADTDCLTVAMALAQDLGPGFSSERSGDLADRGNDWFTP